MKTADFIRKHKLGADFRNWAISVSEDMADVWEEMVRLEKWEFLVTVVSKTGVIPESTRRWLCIAMATQAPSHGQRALSEWLTDERSLRALQVAAEYADGKASEDDLQKAKAEANCASWDANARAAAAKSAYGAAWGDVVFTADASACAGSMTMAKPAQVKMIATLGNPFRKEK